MRATAAVAAVKSKDLILAVRPFTLGRGRERRKNFEIDLDPSNRYFPKIEFDDLYVKGRVSLL